jgi:putative salt-induced outer membrane protein
MRCLSASVALLIPVLVTAQVEPVSEVPDDPAPWSGEVSLGYLASEGNTETSSAAARAKIIYTHNAWESWLEGKGYGSSDDEGTTAESYEVIGRTNYNINDRNYLFGQVEWKKNRFSSYTQQTFETVGYGYRVLTGDVYFLNLEGGFGLTQQKEVISTEPTVTENVRGEVYTLGADFLWQISETASFEQLASANIASDNTAWETITRLKVDIVNSLSLSIGYTVQGNTDVNDDVEKTDRYTSISLDYSF